ncbi:MAG: LamG domain-containing protein, partial [Holophagales bacterium]|nr:LamG domain-containing protein [Holophagales bacterium]
PDGTTKGVGGWIDELKVVEGPFTYEEVCNHARGTLVAVPWDYSGSLRALLQPFIDHETTAFPPTVVSGREAVHAALYGPAATLDPARSDFYICNIDYTTSQGISVHDPGDPEARSIRFAELAPEGEVLWNQYRPESSSNPFCLSCHHPEGKGALTLAALELDTSRGVAEDDPRRQPQQAPPFLLGHVPAGYFAPGKPDVPLNGGPKIDRWIHDGPYYHWTFDEGDGATVRNSAIGDPQAVSTAGTLHGAAFQPSLSRGHALEFDGGADGLGDDLDYVSIDHPVDVEGSELTLSAWMRLGVDGIPDPPDARCRNFHGDGKPCTIIAKSTGVTNLGVDWALRVFYRWDGSPPAWEAQLQVKVGATVHVVAATLVDLTTMDPNGFVPTDWHHLMARFDDGKVDIFLDGTVLASADLGPGSLPTDPTHEVTLGSKLTVGGSPILPFFGLIDDMRIYNRALLDGEVAALAASVP